MTQCFFVGDAAGRTKGWAKGMAKVRSVYARVYVCVCVCESLLVPAVLSVGTDTFDFDHPIPRLNLPFLIIVITLINFFIPLLKIQS
jgi:hypothetical protein